MDLELLTQIAPANKINTKQLLQMSDTFTKTLKMKPPTIANWITAKSDDLETLTQYANDSYPILHENVLLLCQDFLRFKLEQGTPIEKNLYQKLTLITFIDRLIKKVIMIHKVVGVDSTIAYSDVGSYQKLGGQTVIDCLFLFLSSLLLLQNLGGQFPTHLLRPWRIPEWPQFCKLEVLPSGRNV